MSSKETIFGQKVTNPKRLGGCWVFYFCPTHPPCGGSGIAAGGLSRSCLDSPSAATQLALALASKGYLVKSVEVALQLGGCLARRSCLDSPSAVTQLALALASKGYLVKSQQLRRRSKGAAWHKHQRRGD